MVELVLAIDIVGFVKSINNFNSILTNLNLSPSVVVIVIPKVLILKVITNSTQNSNKLASYLIVME